VRMRAELSLKVEKSVHLLLLEESRFMNCWQSRTSALWHGDSKISLGNLGQ
jgi:hypothetical protein